MAARAAAAACCRRDESYGRLDTGPHFPIFISIRYIEV
jgi:hypothetical protein